MIVAIVHTAESPCRCHAALREAVEALGHEARVVPAARVRRFRAALAAADVVFEHADTWRGRHALRPELRRLLERWGCRLAGTAADPAGAADDKAEGHRRLERAGVRVPRWNLVARGTPDLGFPLVVKPSLAHGSDGLMLVRDAAAWSRMRASHAPRLAEEFIEGRELTLTGIEVGGRLRWLPVVEVAIPAGGIYTHALKWGRANPRKTVPEIPAETLAALHRAAARAWRALRLRDYARFDLRLDAAGHVWFLEANVRPSVESGSELRVAAHAAGFAFTDLVACVLRNARARRRPAASPR
ncbi:MAG: ATP-grasp domain-containing protein [Planctomycetes bacterium]|nr:ATP-grasp domain-containing protein [Planctomycetota bacterium]